MAEIKPHPEFPQCPVCGGDMSEDWEPMPVPVEIEKLRAEVEQLKEALDEIARQKLVDELSDDEHENADYEGGYEGCIKRARAARRIVGEGETT